MTTPLAARLADAIRRDGPLPVSEFMAAALLDSEHGYYATRDPFGAAGDFITAPEISQMFGELIGLWAAVAWQAMGAPARVVLAELGPGRGTLMADLLRAAATVPSFRAALDIWLVEASPVLRRRQEAALDGQGAHWAAELAGLPPGPLLLVANEFFDALPIEQYVRAPEGWTRRMVGLDADGRLAFAAEPVARLAYPWGLRLDGLSLWSTRAYGWLELGFDTGYFAEALARTGWGRGARHRSRSLGPLADVIVVTNL